MDEEHTIYSAISPDGIHFAYEQAVFRGSGLVDPDVYWNGKEWVMFVFSDGVTIVAKCSDGLRFGYVGGLGLEGWGTTAPVMLKDGRLRLYAFDQHDLRRVRSFISGDGISWKQEYGVRLIAPPGKRITDPFVIQLKDGSWKMIFKTEPLETGGKGGNISARQLDPMAF